MARPPPFAQQRGGRAQVAGHRVPRAYPPGGRVHRAQRVAQRGKHPSHPVDPHHRLLGGLRRGAHRRRVGRTTQRPPPPRPPSVGGPVGRLRRGPLRAFRRRAMTIGAVLQHPRDAPQVAQGMPMIQPRLRHPRRPWALAPLRCAPTVQASPCAQPLRPVGHHPVDPHAALLQVQPGAAPRRLVPTRGALEREDHPAARFHHLEHRLSPRVHLVGGHLPRPLRRGLHRVGPPRRLLEHALNPAHAALHPQHLRQTLLDAPHRGRPHLAEHHRRALHRRAVDHQPPIDRRPPRLTRGHRSLHRCPRPRPQLV